MFGKSARWWLGPNSLFGQYTKTVSGGNVEGGGIPVQHSLNDNTMLIIGAIALIVLLK